MRYIRYAKPLYCLISLYCGSSILHRFLSDPYICLLEIPFKLPLLSLLCYVIPLVIELFSAAQTYFNLYPGTLEIYHQRYQGIALFRGLAYEPRYLLFMKQQFSDAEILERVPSGRLEGDTFLLTARYLLLEDAALERSFEVSP